MKTEEGIEVLEGYTGVHLTEAKTIEILRDYLTSRGIEVSSEASLTGVRAAHGNAFRCPYVADGGVTLQWDER